MMRRTLARGLARPLALALVLALALGLPTGLADPLGAPPEGAQRVTLGPIEVATWIGTLDNATEEAEPGSVALFVAAQRPTAAANVTSWNFTFTLASDALEVPARAFVSIPAAGVNASAFPWEATRLDATLPANATGTVTYTFTATGTAELDNGTNTTLGTASGSYQLTVPTEAPTPAPGIPTSYLVGGAVLLLAVLAGGIVVGRQRAQRRRMNEGPRRSQVMRELELEKQLEKAKDPEQVQEIKAEIRQQEQVREKRRELQILEAKRADVLKTLDLLKKRHESGGLTKLQYDNMVAKKQGDLQKIEADIAQMEAEDAGGAAAS